VLVDVYKAPILTSLMIIALIPGTSCFASLLRPVAARHVQRAGTRREP
jgi:hypothetical protein